MSRSRHLTEQEKAKNEWIMKVSQQSAGGNSEELPDGISFYYPLGF